MELLTMSSRCIASSKTIAAPRGKSAPSLPRSSLQALLFGLIALSTCLSSTVASAQQNVDSLFDLKLGWVQMRRARDPGLPLVNQGVPQSNLLNANELAYGYQPGLDAALTAHLTDDWSLDARYLGITEYDAAIGRRFGSPVVFQTSPTSMFSMFGTGTAQFNATSAVQTSELNLRAGSDRFGVAGGFRYARLADSLTLAFDGTTNDYSQSFTTTNNLYGFQVGADGRLWQGPRKYFSIDSFAKIGLYINGTRSHFYDLSAANPSRNVFSDGSSSGVAMLSELGIRPRLKLTDYIDLTFGYQMMWLSGVSLASQQMSAHGLLSTAAAGGGVFAPAGGAIPTQINHGDTVFFHGSYVGMEIRW